MKHIVALMFVMLVALVACGGGQDEVASTEDAIVHYTGIDGSQQTCTECCCTTDQYGNCEVHDLNDEYIAMCGTCTESNGYVTYTPRPAVRPRATVAR